MDIRKELGIMAASSERETEDGNCENIKATNGE
jgi:hypothetical protein